MVSSPGSILASQMMLAADKMPDPDITAIEAPLNANVWKVEINEGDKLEKEQVVAILEAMKLEIPVKAEADLVGRIVEKVLVRPNDVVEAGKPLVLTRTKKT
jgi:urea carboxylase